MTVAPTSRWAYETVETNDRQEEVLRALRVLGQANDREIASFLGWTINRVTPRRGELVERELVALARVGPDQETGRKVSFWRLVIAQGDLFDAVGLRPKREGARA